MINFYQLFILLIMIIIIDRLRNEPIDSEAQRFHRRIFYQGFLKVGQIQNFKYIY